MGDRGGRQGIIAEGLSGSILMWCLERQCLTAQKEKRKKKKKQLMHHYKDTV